MKQCPLYTNYKTRWISFTLAYKVESIARQCKLCSFFNLRIVLFFFLNPYSSERNFVGTMKGVFFLCIRIRRKQLEETHYINTSVIRKNEFVAIGLLQNKWQRVSSRTNDNTKRGSKKKLKQLFFNSFCIVFFCIVWTLRKGMLEVIPFEQTYQIGAYWNPCEISLQLFLFAILSISSSKIISHKPSDDEHLQSEFYKHFNNKIQMNFCFVIFSKKDFLSFHSFSLIDYYWYFGIELPLE